jgi:hypothetical protein
VSGENNLSELSFLDAVKVFKAQETEKGIPLHKLDIPRKEDHLIRVKLGH